MLITKSFKRKIAYVLIRHRCNAMMSSVLGSASTKPKMYNKQKPNGYRYKLRNRWQRTAQFKIAIDGLCKTSNIEPKCYFCYNHDGRIQKLPRLTNPLYMISINRMIINSGGSLIFIHRHLKMFQICKDVLQIKNKKKVLASSNFCTHPDYQYINVNSIYRGLD